MDVHQMICEIAQKVDKMTINAFAICGFRKDFIIEHMEDFHIKQNSNNNSYFYKDKFLFTIRTRIENCGKKSITYVEFAKEYEELLDKFNAIPN